jgi:hypothetical protein
MFFWTISVVGVVSTNSGDSCGRRPTWVRAPAVGISDDAFSAWVQRSQLIVIEFLQVKNRRLKEGLRGKRIRFTNAERAAYREGEGNQAQGLTGA